MAIAIGIAPGGADYDGSLHYAAHADSPLEVSSDLITKKNFLFRVTIATPNPGAVTLIQCFFPPTSQSGTHFILETSLGDIVKNLIPEVEPIAADATFRTDAVGGFLHHQIIVHEIYDDDDGVPVEGLYAIKPSAPAGLSDYPCAHNIAHDGDPGVGLTFTNHLILSNDIDGVFSFASHKQLSVYLQQVGSYLFCARVSQVTPTGTSYIYIKDSEGNIPIAIPDSHRIVVPLNTQTLVFSREVTKLIFSIFPVQVPTEPSTLTISQILPPAVGAPPGAGVKIVTSAAHGYAAGNIVTIANTGSETFYVDDFEIVSIIDSTSFYIKAIYDVSEASDENYTVRLAYEDVVDEAVIPYIVEYKVKRDGCPVPIIYANSRGGFDVLDFISEDSVSVNANRDRVKVGNLKRSFNTVTAARRELSTGWIKENDFELMQGFIASSRHWKVDANGDPSEVLLLTDSAKLTERRDVVNVQVVIEDQDLKSNE